MASMAEKQTPQSFHLAVKLVLNSVDTSTLTIQAFHTNQRRAFDVAHPAECGVQLFMVINITVYEICLQRHEYILAQNETIL
jgi:hypothetical protein